MSKVNRERLWLPLSSLQIVLKFNNLLVLRNFPPPENLINVTNSSWLIFSPFFWQDRKKLNNVHGIFSEWFWWYEKKTWFLPFAFHHNNDKEIFWLVSYGWWYISALVNNKFVNTWPSLVCSRVWKYFLMKCLPRQGYNKARRVPTVAKERFKRFW